MKIDLKTWDGLIGGGEINSFDENGAEMSDQELTAERRYFDSGQLMFEYFRNATGRKEGWSRHWLENGQLFSELYYRDGLADGVMREWTADGVLIKRVEYKDGKNHGHYQSWWDDGLPKEEGDFVQGKRQIGYRWYDLDGSLWQVYELQASELFITRKFQLDMESAVQLDICKPEPDGKDFKCTFHITGLGTSHISHAMGIDAVQAMSLALSKAAVILYTSEEYKQGRLTWHGSGDLELPYPEGCNDDATGGR